MQSRACRGAALLCVLLVGAAAGASAQQRGFLFELGIGAAVVNYGPEAEAAMAEVQSLGLDRLEIGLNIGAGWAVTQDVYALGTIEAVATRLYDVYNDWAQFNTYLFGAGVRAYPFHTGLLLGLDGGLARMVIDSNVGVYGISPFGWGTSVLVAYDFNGHPTGLSLQLGLRVHYFVISGGSLSAACVFIALTWK